MVDYVEAKKLAERAAENNEDTYISLNPTTRIHVYTKKEASNNTWYYAQGELLKGKSFETHDTMSANTLKDLSNIIGVLWYELNRISKNLTI